MTAATPPAASTAPVFTVATPLGDFSASDDPVKIANAIAIGARPLAAARVQIPVTEDIIQTIVNRLPHVCEMLRLAQLNPGNVNATVIVPAVMRCIQNVCVAVSRLREPFLVPLPEEHGLDAQAMSEEALAMHLNYLVDRFDDVVVMASPASLLRSQQTPEEAKGTASMLEQVWGTVDFLERLRQAIADVEFDTWDEVAEQRFSNEGHRLYALHISQNNSSTASDESKGLVRVSPTGELILVVLQDAIMVFGMSTGIYIRSVDYVTAPSDRLKIKGSMVAWSPDGQMFAAISPTDPFSVFVCDAISGEQTLFPVAAKNGSVVSLAWAPNRYLLAGTSTGIVSVWDVSRVAKTGQAILKHTLNGAGDDVQEVAWSPDGSMIAAGSEHITVWETATERRMYDLPENGQGLVLWSPDSTKLATVGLSQSSNVKKSVFVWDAVSGDLVRELDVLVGVETAVDWSPDSTSLVIASNAALTNDTLKRGPAVWDVTSGQIRAQLEGSGDVVDVAWSRDGSRIATGTRAVSSGGLHTCTVCDASSGNLFFIAGGEEGDRSPSSVSWGAFGHELVSLSWNEVPSHGELTLRLNVYNASLIV